MIMTSGRSKRERCRGVMVGERWATLVGEFGVTILAAMVDNLVMRGVVPKIVVVKRAKLNSMLNPNLSRMVFKGLTLNSLASKTWATRATHVRDS
jgi:hypothetical protein